jgi:hypothetical protein
MKRLIVTAALAAAVLLPHLAMAQTLVGDLPPGTVAASQPDACVLKVSGGPVAINDIPGTANALQWRFPLTSITTFGKYTLTVTCTKAGSIVSGTNSGTVTTAGSVQSVPFAYSYAVAPVTGLVVQLAP